MAIVAKFSGITGESQIEGKQGWVDLLGYSFHAHVPVAEKGEGFSAGVPDISEVSFTMYEGKHMPDLNQKLYTGKEFGEIIIEELAVSGGKNTPPKTTYRLTLNKAYITTGGKQGTENTNDRGFVNSSIKYTVMKQEYFKQDGENWIAQTPITYNAKKKTVT